MTKELENGCSCGADGEDCCCDENMTVTLTMDDDSEVECAVITVLTAGEREYIALLPIDEDGENEEGEVFLYRFETDEDGEPIIDNIEDDDEYEVVAEAFDEWLDSQEFDELVDECDEDEDLEEADTDEE